MTTVRVPVPASALAKLPVRSPPPRMSIQAPVARITAPVRAAGPVPIEEDVRLNALLSKLQSWRIKPVERPVYPDTGEDINPVLPADLTRLEDVELGALYTEFSAMVVWVGYRHGLAATLRIKLEAEKNRTFSRLFLQQTGNREEKKAKADTDPQMVEIEDDWVLAQTMETLLFPILQGYVAGKEATSREVTRRGGADWGDRRGMGSMAHGGLPSRAGR